MTVTQNGEVSNGGVTLLRELGLLASISFLVSTMIGSGIFVSPGSALRYSGSVGLCLIIWGACGLTTLFCALSFAELGTLIPRSGSVYVYLKESFGPLQKFWGILPAFAYSWVNIIISRPAEVAVVMLTFAEYFTQPIFNVLCMSEYENRELITKAIALVALGLITFINVTSVRLYVRIQNIFAFLKIVTCLIIIGGGAYEVIIGNTENLSKGFEGTTTSPINIALAFYSGLWAYDGWASVTVVTEEVKRPELNIPRSVFIAIPLVTILYIFMNVSYMTIMSFEEITSGIAVAVRFGEKILGTYAFIIPIGVASSTLGCALSLQFSITRLCYVCGQDGFTLESLSYIHHRRLTPAPAVVFQGMVTFLFIVIGNITELIEFVSFLTWMFYGLTMVSVLILRRTMKDVYRPYKVPIVIPIIVLLLSIYLSVTPVVMDPSPKYLVGLGFILIGILVYYWFIYKNKRPEIIMDSITYFVQVLFEVVPSEKST